MANNDIIVSEMTSATQINTGDLMIMTQPDAQAETGYSTKKGTVLQVANKMLKGTEYTTDLPDFTHKNVLEGMEELKGDLTSLLPVDETSGAIANFETPLALPLVSVLANIVASQASGTPTPSNPLPISGYTEANITRCGKNIGQAVSMSAAVIPGGYRAISGGTSLIAFIESGKTYTVSGVTANRGVCAYFDHVPQANDETSYGENIPISSPSTFTATHTGFALIYVNNGTVDTSTAQVENGDRATAYGAYTPTTYTISFGQTVYGGTLDVTRGKLHVTGYKVTLDGTQSILASNFGSGGYVQYRFSVIGEDAIENGYIKSSHYQPLGTGITTDYVSDYYSGGYTRLLIVDSRFGSTITNATDWNTWLSNNNVDVIYELATPFDIDLTPTQIRALVGVNNVFNDTNGNTEVQFKDSIQHYIDKKIAQTQALIL